MIDINVYTVSGKICSEINFNEEKKYLFFTITSYFSQKYYRWYNKIIVLVFGSRAELLASKLHRDGHYLIQGRLGTYKDGTVSKTAVIAELIHKLDGDWEKVAPNESDNATVSF